MNRFALILLTSLSLTFFIPQSVFALTLDKFTTSENVLGDEVESTVTSVPVRTTFTVADSLGGFRTMEALKQSGALSTELVVQGGFLNHAQDPATTGDTLVIWDGDNVDAGINTTGLGGIDFTQDIASPDPNADGFILKVIALDLAPVTIHITVYTDGSRVSRLSHTLNAPVNSVLDIPFLFKDFTAVGVNPADFTNVGAITLKIEGSTPATDLIIDSFTTNGCNEAVPTSSSTSVDQCGVICGNDACLDCLGVPNGTTQPGDPCITGQHGLCSPGTWFGPKPNCTCEPDNQPTNEICDGLDNNCDGTVDENFPNVGKTCSEGDDQCSVNGVFECDGAGGMRCTAEDKKADLKECDESRGCDDVPYSGLEFDECGVCGGDGSLCADCKGIPNGTATLDRCSECDGDGLSCLECTDYDITETQFSMDAGAKAQEKMIKRVLRELKRVDKSSSTLKYIQSVREEAHELQVLNWILSWSLPSVYAECANAFCVNSSNEPQISEYQERSLALKKIGRKAIKKLVKAKRQAGLSVGVNEKRHRKRQNKQHAENIAMSESVPLTVSACS